MSRVAVDLGFIKIYFYSLCIVIGMIFGSFLVIKEAKKNGINSDTMINIIFGTLICGIVGARVYYVLFNLDYYSNHFVEIFEVWNGGLAIHGGIIAGILYICYYVKRYKDSKLSFLKLLDICAPGVVVGQILGRWGNFFNQEAYGPIVSREFLKSIHLPNFIIDGMYIEGEYHHPTFFYESIWNILGLILIILYRKRKNLKVGEITGLYLIWYSTGRFFIEALRQDSLMFYNIKIAQVVSIIMFLIGMVLVIKGLFFSDKKYRD